DALNKSVPNRVGQCVMTCPTTAVYDGMPTAETKIPLGKQLRFFGDGFQKSKQVAGRRYWRIPVMDGEFLVDDVIGAEKGVAGGTSEQTVGAAMTAGLRAATGNGIVAITAGNYGGKLGKFHFHLRKLLGADG